MKLKYCLDRQSTLNSLFGYRTGYVLTTGSNNILLGYQAGDNITSGANNIIIGYDINAPSATGSNQLNIGNAIYGNLSTSLIGIGQPSPSALLDLVGNGLTLEGNATLDDAAGNEIAYQLNYTTNKAAGDDTGLLINMTDSGSPGTSYLIDAQVGGSSRFSVSNMGGVSLASTGNLRIAQSIDIWGSAVPGAISSAANNLTLTLYGRSGNNTGNGIALANQYAFTNTSGQIYSTAILSTYNQTSGTAANTDLLINRTQTAVGSGLQYLLDAQVGGLSKFNISNTGSITSTGTLGTNSIVNGTFDADTDWTKGSGWTIAGGVAVGTATTGNLNETATTVVAGKYYKLVHDGVVTSGTYRITAGGWTSDTISASATITRYFYAVSTAAVTFDGVTSFTGTIDNVVLTEVQSSIAFDNSFLTTSDDTQPLTIKKTLDNATGDQAAMHLVYQTNKAAGNDTGLLIDMLDTSSPGSSNGIDYKVGGNSVFGVAGSGSIISTGAFYTTLDEANISGLGNNVRLKIAVNGFSNASLTAVTLGSGTFTMTSGTNNVLKISPTYNQTSGTAANTDLLISPTLTDIGSGDQIGLQISRGTLAAADAQNNTHSMIKLDGTIGILDGTDTVNGLNIAWTDAADHTGGTINGIRFGNITGDANASEYMFDVTGTGYDYTFNGNATFEDSVGINTIGPDRRLDVLDASNPQMRLTQADNTVYADFKMDSNGDLIMNVDGVSNQLVLDNGGNVGIGTAVPTGKLSVAGDIKSAIDLDTGTLALGSGSQTLIEVGVSRLLRIRNWNGAAAYNEVLSSISNGNVGINTISPDRRLDVLDASNPQMRLTQADNTVYADFKMDSNGDLIMNVDGVSNQLVLDNGGNVGIGTASPGVTLDVQVAQARSRLQSTTGTNYTYASIVNTGGTFTFGLEGSGGGSIFTGTSAYAGVAGHSGAYPLMFATNNAVRMTIDSAGNMGIGDSGPDQLLEILSSGAANTQLSIGNTNAGDYDPQIGFELADGTNIFTLGIDDSDSDKFKISTTGLGTSDRLVIDSSGYVGINAATPGARLHVYTDTSADYVSEFYNDGNNTDRYGLLIQAGEDTPAGTNTLIQFNDGDGTAVGSITYDNTQTYYNTSSDIRLKENIALANIGVNNLMNIKIRQFNFKADPSEELVYGVVAQELYKVYPQAVVIPENDTRYWQVDYSKLTPLIIASIQQQQSEISNFQFSISNEISSTNDQISQITLKTDKNITTLEGLQASIDEELAKADLRFKDNDLKITDLEDQVADLEARLPKTESRLTSIEDLMIAIQDQIDELKQLANTELNLAQIEQNKTDIDYLKLLLGINRSENPEDVSLLGKLTASEVVAGVFTVKIIDEDAKTIGTDEIKTGEKLVTVKTKSVADNAKIFITSQSDKALSFPLTVTDKKEGESFTVSIPQAAEENIKFDWWIVEEK